MTVPQTSFAAGTYTFVAEQKGQQPNSLAVAGPGVSSETRVIEPGGASQELTVTLGTGTYELWCPVGDHRAQGMTLTVTVK